jgi:drug/metabolite transporter (DMT)-like permease
MSESAQRTWPSGAGLLANRRLLGIVSLSAGIAVFAVQDVIVKLLSGAYPVHEMVVVRGLVGIVVLAALVAFEGGGLRSLASERPWALTARGFVMFLAYLCYYMGLAVLPMASLSALFFTGPLYITMLSVVVLGEHVGPRRWTAVLVGFLGVLVMVQPGSEVFSWASLFGLAAGLFYAFAAVMARTLGRGERASIMSFYGNGVILLSGIALAAVFGSGEFAAEEHTNFAFLLRGWAMPNVRDFLLLAACGVLAATGLTLLAQGYRVAPANAVAPFEYTALIWAALYGWIFWRDFPSPITMLGMAIVVAAGLYVLYREGKAGERGEDAAALTSIEDSRSP